MNGRFTTSEDRGRQIGGFEMEASFSGFGYYPRVPPPGNISTTVVVRTRQLPASSI
jgi:hypothetical protein